ENRQHGRAGERVRENTRVTDIETPNLGRQNRIHDVPYAGGTGRVGPPERRGEDAVRITPRVTEETGGDIFGDRQSLAIGIRQPFRNRAVRPYPAAHLVLELDHHAQRPTPAMP